MSRKQHGFTLIELMIVIAIIAIIAAIAIPNLLAARLSANETAAIATLRNIVSAQAQFQQSAKADDDDDGTGEYGGFAELSGALPGRMNDVLVPAVLSASFQGIVNSAEGLVSRSGYLFKMWLPAPGGVGLEETNLGYVVGDTDADLAETTWCCYAWPVNYNQSGNRTFFVNQAGDVLACEVPDYSGPAAADQPTADAAFGAGIADPAAPLVPVPGAITQTVALGGAGNNPNGELWKQVN